MTTVTATVRGGRLELAAPLNLPDGTAVVIALPDAEDVVQSDDPAAVEEWLRWYDELEPLFSPEERAEWDANRAAQKAWELSQWDARAEKLRRMWE